MKIPLLSGCCLSRQAVQTPKKTTTSQPKRTCAWCAGKPTLTSGASRASWHLFEFVCKEGLAKPSHLNYCLSMFNLGRTLSHTSTGATSRLRWRTTTRMTSCCCALAVTRPQTCTTGSWSSGWPRSTPLRRAARRAFGCWRMQTAGGCDRPLGLSSAPVTGCPSPGKRSSC